MVTKSISLATGIVSLDVFLRSQLFSNDPLFLFISNSWAVNMLMIALATLAIYLSFKKKFNSWHLFAGASIMAPIFIACGFLGIFYSDSLHTFWSAMLPLNYIMLMQIGIVFAICCLGYDHADMPANYKLRLARLKSLPRPTFSLPVPKALHPPMALRRLSGGAN